MKVFQQFPKAKGRIYIISNLEYTQLTFSLLTVYYLFIQHNIFKDCIDRSVLNLAYGWESRYILVVGRASHIAAGEICFRRLEGWRKLWRTLTRTQSEHLNHLKIQTGITLCFVYVKISLFLQYRMIVFDYEKFFSGFPIVGAGGLAPILQFFLNPLPPKLMPPWATAHPLPPHLKMKPHIWKTNPSLKHETPFHEMISRSNK